MYFAMTTTKPTTKHVIAIGNNGRLTTTFSRLEIGQKCRVMLGGEWQVVERIPWIKSGSTAFNVRKCDGLQGRAFVYSDRIVEVVE